MLYRRSPLFVQMFPFESVLDTADEHVFVRMQIGRACPASRLPTALNLSGRSKYVLGLIVALLLTVGFVHYAMSTQRQASNARYDALWKRYAALSCKCNGIGPTGGFCLEKNKFHVGGNHMWCKNLAKELRRLFNGQSVYDFGAGLGWYGKALLAGDDSDAFRVRSYKAFDGAENIEDVFPDGFVKHLDLSKPVYLSARDWVLSLEVGEHIPRQYQSVFVDNLHRHNTKGIVLSWAVEGKVKPQRVRSVRTLFTDACLFFRSRWSLPLELSQ